MTPIFTTSYSGLFKSFIDVLDPDALSGLPIVIGATGGTERHSLALDYGLRPLFSYLHAVVVPTGVYAASGSRLPSCRRRSNALSSADGAILVTPIFTARATAGCSSRSSTCSTRKR